jgi:UDP-N-acetylglucosamine--N-acetylmuramyl-(pentapeptide) pyrophosphoryl-undecaprenol N-acetylglucosamine transferase
MKILFAGGGSLGPVTPLLATAAALKRLDPSVELAWAGTPDGPERALVEAQGIAFTAIPVAKFPRYPDLRWITFPFDAWRASSAAHRLVHDTHPDAVASVGGFTAVPIIRAAAKHGIPCLIHQLDVVTTLSNRAVERLCVSKTSSFDHKGFEKLPTPTRFSLSDLGQRAPNTKPVVLVMGGGQGAQALNEAVVSKLDRWLERANIIHVTGKGKMSDVPEREGYSAHELLDAEGMRRAYAVADVIVTRAGIGSLSEVAALKKAAIIVPIPQSHQVANALAFSDAKAGLYVKQDQEDFADILFQQAKALLDDPARREKMGETVHAFFPTDDGTAFAEKIKRAV